MPMPKPTKTSDVNIGANGVTDQKGREPKTLDIKVVKPYKADIPDIANRMAELAAAAKAKS